VLGQEVRGEYSVKTTSPLPDAPGPFEDSGADEIPQQITSALQVSEDASTSALRVSKDASTSALPVSEDAS
jgi:hypothetical protein